MKIELEIKDPPGPPKHHEWEVRGYNHKSDIPGTYARACPTLGWGIADYYAPPGNSGCFYLEAVRTHHDDGVPIEITPLPTMPAHVERVEYHGQYMRPGDMGSADNYITYYIGDTEWSRISHIKAKFTDKKPANSALYYARVFYKKEKPAPTEKLPERDGWRFELDQGKWGMTKMEMLDIGCDSVLLWLCGCYCDMEHMVFNYGSKDTFYVPAFKLAKPAKKPENSPNAFGEDLLKFHKMERKCRDLEIKLERANKTNHHADYGDFTEHQVRELVADYCRSISLGYTGWGVTFITWLDIHEIAKHDKLHRLKRIKDKD
tara:strand:+ start:7699 stop:8652 length:954 start_codon:yes stop_codon:yes gene_type:complete